MGWNEALPGNEHNLKHGMSFSPEYGSWHAMRRRCLNETDKDYPNYGGRGVKICKEWDEFLHFFADMGSRPPKAFLDRIDVNGDYEPGNCRWTTITPSNRNKRSNIRVVFEGQTMTLKEACRAAGVSYSAIWHRMDRHNLTLDEALVWSPTGG